MLFSNLYELFINYRETKSKRYVVTRVQSISLVLGLYEVK